MTRRQTVVYLTILVMVSYFNSSVQAQDESLEERIEQLEQQVERLTEEVGFLLTELETVRQIAQGDIPVEPEDPLGTTGVSFFGIHSWLVQISQQDKTNDSGLQTQLDNARASLASINQRLGKARSHLEEVSQKRPVLDLYLGEEVLTNVHPQATIDQAALDVQNLEQQQKNTQAQMARLEGQIIIARDIRQITGQTADGRQVILVAQGSLAQLITDMQEGQWYRVYGTGNDDDEVIKITVKTITKHSGSP